MICRRSKNTYSENVFMTDEPPKERLYTNGRQKCRCRLNAVYVRVSKIVYYESPYIVTGDIQHTGSKGNLRVYVKIGISEHGKVGTRSGLHRYEVLSGKINDIT